MTGDMNLDYSSWQNPEQRQARMIDLVKTELEPRGFYQMVTNVTRYWPHQEDSLVDHCWSNTEDRVISYSNELRTGSDHNIISVRVRMKDRIMTVQEVQRRMRRNLDTKQLIEDMKEVDWKDLLLSKNVDVINDILEAAIRDTLDRHAPVKTVQVRGNFRSWVGPDLKDKMKLRDSLRESARSSGDDMDWRAYRKMRNEVTKDVKKTKDDHFKDILEKLSDTNDTRKIYRTTKQLLGWQPSSTPTSFLVASRLIKKPTELANVLIDHFEQKINILKNKQWPKEADPLIPLKAALQRWGNSDQIVSFKFKEISLIETTKLVTNLSNSVSFGHDEVDAMTIKLILPQIIIPLNHLVNTSLRENRFAMKWKLARLLPLLKEKDSNRLDPAQYKLISLLSTVSKIVERAAQVQLLKHFEDSELLNASSHAYCPGLSTTTTLAQICEKIYKGVEDKDISEIMTVDQSEAFNTINHKILLDKLELYGVGEDARAWIKDYLEGRSQYMKVGAASSRWRTVNCGVLQGSVFGPLLYTIYVNDMTEAVRENDCPDVTHTNNDKLFGTPCPRCGELITYADDSTYHIANRKRADNQKKISTNILRLKQYMNNNELSINIGKTKVL